MDINNLTSVYNQNPTLQGQYTLQQYLDMFGGSTYTPPTAPTPTPTPTTDPGQGIVNAGINQYQNNDKPGEGANFATTPGNKYGLNKDTMRTEMVSVADGMGGTKFVEMTTAEDAGGIRKNMETNKNINHAGLKIRTPLTMAFDFLSGKKNTDDDEYLEDGSIIGTFNNPDTKGKSLIQKFKANLALKKEQSMLTGELQRQKELKEQIAKEEAAAAKQAATIEQIRQQYAAQGRDYGQGAASQATQDSYSDGQGGYAGASTQDYGGGEKDGGYIDGTNRRKKIIKSYFKGGIVSLRRR